LYDDATRFAYAAAVVDWAVPMTNEGKAFVKQVSTRLKATDEPIQWLCWLVVLSKYGNPNMILDTTLQQKRLAAKEPFLARQRIAILTRCLGTNPKEVTREWRSESAAGYPDSASVASNLLRICEEQFPSKRSRLYSYLFPELRPTRYPVSKFLLLCDVAYSEHEAQKSLSRPEVSSYVTDSWYRHWIRGIHLPWVP